MKGDVCGILLEIIVGFFVDGYGVGLLGNGDLDCCDGNLYIWVGWCIVDIDWWIIDWWEEVWLLLVRLVSICCKLLVIKFLEGGGFIGFWFVGVVVWIIWLIVGWGVSILFIWLFFCLLIGWVIKGVEFFVCEDLFVIFFVFFRKKNNKR